MYTIGRGEGDVRIEDMVLRGQRVKQVEQFAYLGGVFTSDGKFTQDVEIRRTGATRAFGTFKRSLWGRRDMSVKVKMKIFTTVALPLLLYGTSTWALTRTEQRRLDTFEMRMLRNITGVRWDHFVRNEDIRVRLYQPPVSIRLRRTIMKWFWHVERMGGERQVKESWMLKWKVEGRLEGLEQDGRPFSEETWRAVDWAWVVPGPWQLENYHAGLMWLQRRGKLSQVSQVRSYRQNFAGCKRRKISNDFRF